MSNLNFEAILIALPGILMGFTVHEYMHAKTAWLLGDDTAYMQGRVSLNPIKHIDIIGFVLVLVAGFGWAKPVLFNPEKLKNPRKDEMLIAIAGPLSNVALAIFCTLLLWILLLLFPYNTNVLYQGFINMILAAIYINYGLFIFNILPIPPLDGSHLILKSMPIDKETEAKIYRYGTFILLGIIILGSVADIDLLPIGKLANFLAKGSLKLLGVYN